MFWIYLIAGLIIGFAGYYIGYKNAENTFKAKLEEHVGEMLNEKIEQVKGLYEETYRNVLRHLVEIIKEEENGQK
jgi:hypothetical protein